MRNRCLLATLAIIGIVLAGCSKGDDTESATESLVNKENSSDAQLPIEDTRPQMAAETGHKGRSVIPQSKPVTGIVELDATPSLSVEKINLGNARPAYQSESLKPSQVSQALEIIEKTLTLQSPIH